MPPQRPTVSLKEARKILGKEAGQRSDSELLQVINTLTFLAREHFLKTNPNTAKSTVRFNCNMDGKNGTKR